TFGRRSRACLAPAQRVPEDVVVHYGEQLEPAGHVQRRIRHRGERLLEVPHRVRSHPSLAQRQQRPGMPHEQGPGPPRDLRECLPPARGRQLPVRDQHFGHDRVVHEVEQLVLAANVVVKGHRAGPELGGDPTHGYRPEALGVGDGQGYSRNLLAREARPAAARLGAGPDRTRRPGAWHSDSRKASVFLLFNLVLWQGTKKPSTKGARPWRARTSAGPSAAPRRSMASRCRYRAAPCSPYSVPTVRARPRSSASWPLYCRPAAAAPGSPVTTWPVSPTRSARSSASPASSPLWTSTSPAARTCGSSAASPISASGWPAGGPPDRRRAPRPPEVAGRPVRTYSGGMRRRVDIAAGLVASPSVLFLDEPTTGLDPRGRLDVWALIADLVGRGTTLLLTTQYLEEADRLADRIAVL